MLWQACVKHHQELWDLLVRLLVFFFFFLLLYCLWGTKEMRWWECMGLISGSISAGFMTPGTQRWPSFIPASFILCECLSHVQNSQTWAIIPLYRYHCTFTKLEWEEGNCFYTIISNKHNMMAAEEKRSQCARVCFSFRIIHSFLGLAFLTCSHQTLSTTLPQQGHSSWSAATAQLPPMNLSPSDRLGLFIVFD